MTPAPRPKPHRKFIALIVAASIAITGVSAVPARAGEDVVKVIAGLALLGLLGAAINKHRDREPDPVVTRPFQPQPGWDHHRPGVRPLPRAVARYDLPSSCVRFFPRYSNRHTLMGQNCLQQRYGHVDSLPRECRVTFWNGRRNHTAYKPDCLRSRGYRLVHR